ncbi:MAG: hypothetical protein VCE91_21105 [Nitrospinota bacterium]
MTIEERMERLEQENRRMRRGMSAMAAAALLIMGTANPPAGARKPGAQFQGAQIHDVVRAREFRVIGGDSRVKVRLGVDQKSGAVFVYGTDGMLEAAILGGTPGEGGTVGTYLPGSRMLSALIGTHTGGGGGVTIFDRRGGLMMSLTSNARGEGKLVQYGPAGKTRDIWPRRR